MGKLCEVCGSTECNGHTKSEQIGRLQARVEELERDSASWQHDYLQALAKRDPAPPPCPNCDRLAAEKEMLHQLLASTERARDQARADNARLREALELIRGYGRSDMDSPEHEIAYVRRLASQAIAAQAPGESQVINGRLDCNKPTPAQVEALTRVANAASWMEHPLPALAMALAALRATGWGSEG